MKVFTIILQLIAVALIIYNATKLNFNALTQGDSFIALATIIAAACAILMLQILRVSKRIEKTVKRK